ncbi:PREDICTED: putative F-box protein At5g66830 [Camelina sativa]|uniref:F-box protein At5g66830 n=1 Tax=Camelina sativa TaxID=90675 RepID=A0ABM0UTV6_CAMSA|nr:PREDICTED: putative F-box protein At5g66830 [Camelina sativa]
MELPVLSNTFMRLPVPHESGPLTDDGLLLPLAKKRNPHPQCYCWSQLPSDLLQLVFDRLGFADFQRAKSVCSSWQSVSRNSQPNNQIPWMIRFPKGNDPDHNYCLLFNPEEKYNMYKTPKLGNDFSKSFCVATYRSWLLMQPQYEYMHDHQFNLYILHLLTGERINLPAFKTYYGLTCPILWIDEKTEDHLVIGMAGEDYAVSFKKGDKSWRQIPTLSGIEECFSMVFKDHKLYCLNYAKLKIFDFSGDTPLRVFKTSVSGCLHQPSIGVVMRLPGEIPGKDRRVAHFKNNVVVNLAGDVLIAECHRPCFSNIWEFKIHKMLGNNEWERVVSLGDEAILLDLGITVLAKDLLGIKSNSIYFSTAYSFFEDQYDKNEIFIFNLDSNKVELPHRFVSSSYPRSRSRWFLPSFKRE